MEALEVTDKGINACKYIIEGAKSRSVVPTELAPEDIAEIVHGYLQRVGEGAHKIRGKYFFNSDEIGKSLEADLKKLKAIPTANLGDYVEVCIGVDKPEMLVLNFRRKLLAAGKGYKFYEVTSPDEVILIEYQFRKLNTPYATSRPPLTKEIELLNSLSCVSQKTL